jgi:hypothetical protein
MADGAGWRAVRLDDVEAVPWRGTDLVWRPLRAALGASVVGLSAYTASAGQEVVEDHVETIDGRGHEEVYAVLSGRARFTLDTRTLDAPAGMFLVVSADVRRSAVALEDGTAVLAIGGPPTFVPATSEWIDRARPHLRENPAEARRLLDELAAQRPDSPGLHFGEAMLAAAQGDTGSARAHLDAGIAAAPVIRGLAEQEPLLAPLLRPPEGLPPADAVN